MTTEEVFAAYERLADKDKTFVLEVIAFLQSENDKEWMTVREAALRLGLSPTSIRKKIEESSIRSKNIAERKTLVAVEDVESIAKGRRS